MGTVYQTKRDREKYGKKKAPWTARWKQSNGRYTQRKAGRTRQEALAYLRTQETLRDEGKDLEETSKPKRYTLAETRRKYEEWYVERRKKSSFIRISSTLNVFSECVSITYTDEITQSLIDDFEAFRSASGTSKVNCNNDLRNLKVFIKGAIG